MQALLRRTVAVTLSLCTAALGAQATPLVAPDARVYRDIDRLAAAGLIDTLVVGTRPFSEREILRLLAEARRNLEREPASAVWAERVIDGDVARYANHGRRAFDAAGAELALLDSPYRDIPPDENGEADASINPLAANRGGRPLADGVTASLETLHSASIGSRIAVFFNPRLTALSPRPGSGETKLHVQSGGVILELGNARIEAGREYTVFGQSPSGGLLLSENAPTMDLVRISNDHPATLPWLFRRLGPIRASAFVADLGGAQQTHPHAKLAGYHIALLPHPRFELGAEVIDAMGGRGGQPASFGDRVVDAIPLIDAIFRSGTDFQFSNKMAGIDFHWRMPAWRGFELYGEGDADDFDIRRLRSTLLEDSGYLLGTSLSCLAGCGRFAVRAEYRQTGIRFYTHSDYPLERRGLLLGDPLGPRATSGTLTFDGESALGYLAVTGAFEVRGGNRYGSMANGPGTEGFHFVLLEQHPSEKRTRLVATWTSPTERRRVSLSLTGGGERVVDFRFVPGQTRMHWLARTAIAVRP